jgi:hypothetical protein
MITEDQLEQLCSGWFKDQAYNIAPDGPTPEHEDYHLVILRTRLLKLLVVNNY